MSKSIFSTTIDNLIQMVADRLVNGKRFDLLLAAYNRMQDDERNGVDYLFNVTNSADVICCLQGGLTMEQLRTMLNEYEATGIEYCYFGCNHPTPTMVTLEKVISQLTANADEIVKYAIAYPSVDEYKAIYELFITEEIIK